MYSSIWGIEPVVTKICRDQDDIEADCANATASIRDHVYTITIPKSISGPSTTSIQLARLDTQSDLSYILPSDFVPSKVS